MDNSEFSVSNYPVMKDSGVEWLGEIPVEWEVKKLRYIVNLKSGNNLTANQIKEDGAYPVYGGNGLRGYYHEFTHEGDFILIGRQGALCGNINYPASKFWATDHAVVVEPLSDYKLVWLGEVLRIMNLNQYSVAAAQPGLSVETICNLFIPWPLLEEQTAIANFLDRKTAEIDALIAQKERLLELYEEEKTAIINHAVTKGLDPNAELKDSSIGWLREIPVGWDVMPVKFNLAVPITDGPHETPEFINDGVPFISAESIKNDRIDFGKKRGNISWEDHHRYSMKYKPKVGDVYMVKSGATTGNLARVETDIEFNIWSPLAALRSNAAFLSTGFLFFFMKSRAFFTAVELGWNYGTQQNIGMNVIENLRMVRPPLREQITIVQHIEAETARIDAKITKTQRIIELQKEYRTALISDVVTGKIKVSHLAGEEAAR